MFDFSNQVVVITGAVGNLGSAVTSAFHVAGARLVLVDRGTPDRLERAFPELAGSPDHLLAHSTDLTDVAAVEAMAAAAFDRFGRIDVLVNTAGGYRAGTPLHETPLETLDFLFNLNARSVITACRAVIPTMLKRQAGKIVSISARPGLHGDANAAFYSASKAAVLRLTESMAAELKDSGINVNCILPGTIDTPQNRQASPKADFGRWVQPESLAGVILFLASAAARDIHGAAIPVYGRS
ncbi:MAG: SDR family NAD(P)-dependent oxidoreductase [Chloroflexi bacterium]|nr:SDR family NAD(P)-dependent oxidoreductase [Chloroflexota bacterium]MCI0579521.1 SDR family NAD(P)-dependent oxidoreductase [Chloroflexota bacterium]MCI0644440.1 SDR family NAD(P)-dependent oxidoreductase [Chloroflexota bacterium]MCI0725396.1 SDR family NAD(P)-dependent oxidoreductase [Chloroflexota bacterium]